MSAQFAIGIDLGTTNSVVAFCSLSLDSPAIQVLPVPQIVAPGQVEALDHLPSFLYLPTDQEQSDGALALGDRGDRTQVVGAYAARVSAEQPERTVAAAKSWLCHAGVDRHSKILPWDAPAEVDKISPVAASTAFLLQLIAAWHQQFPEAAFAEQKVVLTVPASFDMAARELTRQAALNAGFPTDFILLEEPQAAVYHWLSARGDAWRQQVTRGDVILVVDVGGGTTDLSLIGIEEDQGEVLLRRLAVGNHLLVGGDNMDLALAHYASLKFAAKGTKLNPWQAVALWHSCRQAKERLLAATGDESQTISVLGRSSRLIGGTVSVSLTKAEAEAVLIDGFFPLCSRDAQPQRQAASGFQELGLPFETDTAVTRHVAGFLAQQFSGEPISPEPGTSLGSLATTIDDPARPRLGLPNKLLFNGGVFQAVALRDRLREVLDSWSDSDSPTEVLGGPEDLGKAVACGAAFYAWSKQHGGLRIRGGTARSYYVGIETAGLAVPGMARPLIAVCVLPFGTEEGSSFDVPGREVGLVVGQKVSFRFFSSSVRKQDIVGTTLRYWDEEELQETAPLEIELPVADPDAERFVPVHFSSHITELGVFELWCVAARGDQRWKLELNVREA